MGFAARAAGDAVPFRVRPEEHVPQAILVSHDCVTADDGIATLALLRVRIEAPLARVELLHGAGVIGNSPVEHNSSPWLAMARHSSPSPRLGLAQLDLVALAGPNGKPMRRDRALALIVKSARAGVQHAAPTRRISEIEQGGMAFVPQ